MNAAWRSASDALLATSISGPVIDALRAAHVTVTSRGSQIPAVTSMPNQFGTVICVLTVAIPDGHCWVTSIGLAATRPNTHVEVHGFETTVVPGWRPVLTIWW